MNPISLVRRIRDIAKRNVPARKPQLWENLSLALRRRAVFEIMRRLDRGWIDAWHEIFLSPVGFGASKPPVLKVLPRESTNRAMFLYGVFEISETRLVQAFLRPGMTFFDIGANIGYYTSVAAALLGSSGRVISFEPNPDIRNRLQLNVDLNGFSSVVIRPEAVSRNSGELSFYISELAENTGMSSLMPGPGRSAIPVAVPAISLDDFVKQIGGHVDLIKLDIEGAELPAIDGARMLLQAPHAPSLLFESFTAEPVIDALHAHGYQTRRLHYSLKHGLELVEPGVTFENIFKDYEAPNYFATKTPEIFLQLVERCRQFRSYFADLLG